MAIENTVCFEPQNYDKNLMETQHEFHPPPPFFFNFPQLSKDPVYSVKTYFSLKHSILGAFYSCPSYLKVRTCYQFIANLPLMPFLILL